MLPYIAFSESSSVVNIPVKRQVSLLLLPPCLISGGLTWGELLQVLDSALLRPGRFDRQVTVDRPDISGRVQILKVHSRGKQIGKDVDFDKVARRTPGVHASPFRTCSVITLAMCGSYRLNSSLAMVEGA